MDENGLESNNILSLLKDDNRQKRVTGALLMMDKAFLCVYPRKVQEAKFPDVECKKEIFTIIEQMLKSEDDLSVYSAAWCIAWAGFGEADIIPQEAIADIAERLVELWISDMSASPNLKRVISWGLASVCIPGLKMEKKSGLAEVIESNFNAPENSKDRIAAVHVAIVTNEWSIDEAKLRLKQFGVAQEYSIRESRFLKIMKVVPIYN